MSYDQMFHEATSFMPLAQATSEAEGTYVDVIAVVKSATPIMTSFGRKCRKFFLMDSSKREVQLNVWDNRAEETYDIDPTGNPILLLNNVLVVKRGLTCTRNSVIQVDPDTPVADGLRYWFDRQYDPSDFCPMNWFRDLIADDPSCEGRFRCVVLDVQLKTIYKSCPVGHPSKMLEKEDGAFFCKDCNFGHGSYRLSMVLSMLLDDYRDELPVTVFNEWAEELLGASADQVDQLRSCDPDRYRQLLNGLRWKCYEVTLSKKKTEFQDQLDVHVSDFIPSE